MRFSIHSSKHLILGAAVCAPFLFTPGPARAGAWTQKAGAGQVIATTGQDVSPVGNLASGQVAQGSTLSQIYVEYGLWDGLTIGGGAFAEIAPDGGEDGSASVSVFARQRIWQSDTGGVAALQIGYSQPVEKLIGSAFAATNPDSTPEVQLRALYGRGFWGNWGNAFVSMEAGYDWRSEGAPDELRFDISTGYQPFDCCMGILGVFATYPIEHGEDPSLKVAPSITYTFRPDPDEPGEEPPSPTTLQFGVSQDMLDFDNGFGVQISIWRPF